MVSRSAPEPDHDEIYFPARSVCNQKSRQQQNELLWEHVWQRHIDKIQLFLSQRDSLAGRFVLLAAPPES
jgi:hypothetical protein